MRTRLRHHFRYCRHVREQIEFVRRTRALPETTSATAPGGQLGAAVKESLRRALRRPDGKRTRR